MSTNKRLVLCVSLYLDHAPPPASQRLWTHKDRNWSRSPELLSLSCDPPETIRISQNLFSINVATSMKLWCINGLSSRLDYLKTTYHLLGDCRGCSTWCRGWPLCRRLWRWGRWPRWGENTRSLRSEQTVSASPSHCCQTCSEDQPIRDQYCIISTNQKQVLYFVNQ